MVREEGKVGEDGDEKNERDRQQQQQTTQTNPTHVKKTSSQFPGIYIIDIY